VVARKSVPTPAARKQVADIPGPGTGRDQASVYILPDHNFVRQSDGDTTRYEPITVEVQVINFLYVQTSVVFEIRCFFTPWIRDPYPR
jgi:hypothetical protein